jgi:hypothetical protein
MMPGVWRTGGPQRSADRCAEKKGKVKYDTIKYPVANKKRIVSYGGTQDRGG